MLSNVSLHCFNLASNRTEVGLDCESTERWRIKLVECAVRYTQPNSQIRERHSHSSCGKRTLPSDMMFSRVRRPLSPLVRRRHRQQCVFFTCHSFDKSMIQETDAETLQQQGFCVSPVPLLSESTCRALHQRIPKLFAGDFDTGVYPDEWHWRCVAIVLVITECLMLLVSSHARTHTRSSYLSCIFHILPTTCRQGIGKEDGVTREICNAWKSDRLIASIILKESLGKLVSELMDWPSARIAQDDVIWKPPAALSEGNTDTVVGFHQDSAYISSQFDPFENNSVTLWMALDDTDEETGCLQYIAGSHLRKVSSVLLLPYILCELLGSHKSIRFLE